MEQYAMLNFDREDSVLIAESGQEKALFNAVNMLGVELKERLEGMQIQRNEIVAANDRLKSLLKEKEILLKEVRHRVKNNLQVVLGLIKIQHRRLESVEVKEMLRESEARITMIAMVHEQLCLMENLAFVQINDYLNSLLSLIANIYEKKYSLIFRSSVQKNCTLSADKTVSFGLLINEIISNAVKHASPKGGGGDIGVLLSPCSKGLLLVVKDRGIGMDTSFMTKECTIGMSLIHSLAAQREFDLNFIDAQGLTVEIILPRGTYN